MDPRLQSSFIPKKPLMEHSAASVRPVQKASLFLVIAIVVFVIMIGLAGAVYFYNSYLGQKIVTLQQEIAATQQKYLAANSSFDKYARLDLRIQTANEILANHFAVSSVFSLLEKDTVKNVRFNSFTFSITGTSTPLISMAGQAKSFNSISVQSDVFRQDPSIKNPVFSGVGLDDKGNVSFHVDAALSPSVLFYTNALNMLSAPDSAASSQTVPSQSGTTSSKVTN